jgi:serine/threonine protein kinase
VPPDERRFGNYVLEEQLAKGGMAEVWRARRLGVAGFARKVCVKQILPAHAEERAFVEMFIDEANTGAQLRHGNIVGIDDFGEVDGRYFIAMEFVAGVDLARLMRHTARAGETLPLDVSVFIAREVLSALDYAHRKMNDRGAPLGIVHRDVSPHNVLVSYSGEVKLTDFGIAKAATRLHHTVGHVVKGKLAYMAPEQAKRVDIDGRADLFALGVIFYEMVTGERPFARANESEMLYAVLRGDRRRVRELRSDVPASIARVVERLLATQPEDRYPSGGEALADLAEYPSNAVASRQLAALVAAASPHPAHASAKSEPIGDATTPALRRAEDDATSVSTPPIDYGAGGTEIAATWAAGTDAPTMISDAASPSSPPAIARTRVAHEATAAAAEARETSPTAATRTIARPSLEDSVVAAASRKETTSPARRPSTYRALTVVSFVLLGLSAAALAYVLLAR